MRNDVFVKGVSTEITIGSRKWKSQIYCADYT